MTPVLHPLIKAEQPYSDREEDGDAVEKLLTDDLATRMAR